MGHPVLMTLLFEKSFLSSEVNMPTFQLQGVRAVKESGLDGVRYVFIQPPSLEVLEERLRARGTETEEAIEKVVRKTTKHATVLIC